MDTSRTIWALGILLVLAIVAAGVSYFAKAPAPSVETPASTQSLVLKATLVGDEYRYEEKAEYYTVSLTYPAVPLSGVAGEKATLAIERALADSVEQFKADGNFENLTPEDVQIQGLGGDRKYALDIAYQSYVAPGYVSYLFTIYQDTLGAHPNAYYKTFVFNQSGETISLEETPLVASGEYNLERISQHAGFQVRNILQQRLGIEDVGGSIFEEGLVPKAENFQNFVLVGDDIHIFFPPYQVAAYAAGSFEITIHKGELGP